MNKVNAAILILFFAISSNGTLLKSFEHEDCRGGPREWATRKCDPDEKFSIDQNGRCGCLPSNEIIAPEICKKMKFAHCGPGLTMSRLYMHTKHASGAFLRVFAGCGCYATVVDADEALAP